MSYKERSAEVDTSKDAWGRQLHLLNMLTAGQLIATQGELAQNPYYIAQGCDMMLEVLGTMIQEDVIVRDKEGNPVMDVDGKTPKKTKVKGIETPTYKLYVTALAEIRSLINYAMNNKISNRNEVLTRAYVIGRELKSELLQKASDFNLDFKTPPSVYDAWKE